MLKYFLLKKQLKARRIFTNLIELNKTIVKCIFLLKNVRFKKNKKFDRVLVDRGKNYTARKLYIESIIDDTIELGLVDSNLLSKVYIDRIAFLSFLIEYFKTIIDLKKRYFKNNVSSKYFYPLLLLILKIKISRANKIYIFNFVEFHIPLLADYCANVLNKDVSLLINSRIYGTLHRFNFVNIELWFTNKLFLNEYESYKRIGWIHDINVKKLVSGSENLILKNNEFTGEIDIGFYSTGSWARKEGYRIQTKNELEKKINRSSFSSKIERIVIRHLVKFSKEYNYTFKVFLHPYEKKLIKEMGVYPPYYQELKKNNIPIDINNVYSNPKEAKIGISIFSNVFFERLSFHKISLCYQFKTKKDRQQIPLRFFKGYEDCGFNNLRELDIKIMRYLRGNR